MKDEKVYETIKSWHERETDDVLKLSMQEVMNTLEEDMRIALARETGVSGVVKGAQAIIKAAKAGNRDFIKGMWQSCNKWCICDEARAVRFNEKMPLEELSDKELPIDINRIFEYNTRGAKMEITLPPIADLKLWDKTHKPKKNCKQEAYCLDSSIPLYVNVRFLIDMMMCLPNAKVTTAGKFNSALYFVADNGDGILIPVKPPKKPE